MATEVAEVTKKGKWALEVWPGSETTDRKAVEAEAQQKYPNCDIQVSKARKAGEEAGQKYQPGEWKVWFRTV